MLRIVMGLFILASIIPACWADDLTDAITNADPRSRLQTGTGAALGALLGPKDSETDNAPAKEEEFNQFPTLPSYGLSSKDLHDPMGTAGEEGPESSPEALKQDNAVGGYANQEPGVHYQDSSSPYSPSQ